MNAIITSEMRERIARFLPDALMHAIESYYEFATKDRDEKESKKFAANQAACKASIAHAKLLIGLARDLGLLDPGADSGNRILLASLIHEAEGQVRSYETLQENEE